MNPTTASRAIMPTVPPPPPQELSEYTRFMNLASKLMVECEDRLSCMSNVLDPFKGQNAYIPPASTPSSVFPASSEATQAISELCIRLERMSQRLDDLRIALVI